MKATIKILLIGGSLATMSYFGWSQPPELPMGFIAQTPQDGVEVQTRGPVHEAFIQAIDNKPGPSRAVSKAPSSSSY